jgi:hypothetical protein
MASNGRTSGELGRIWKEPFVVKSRYYPEICFEGLNKTAKILRIACVQGEVRKQHLTVKYVYTQQYYYCCYYNS